jgi:hypothetical protein
MTRRWPAAAVSWRITRPECTVCGRSVGSPWYEDALGAPFCRAHLGMPRCRFCSAPVTEPGLCGPCHADAVWTQDDVRREVPQVRASLHAMGIRLLTPVRVTLAPDGLGTVSGSGRRRAGLTVTRGAEVLGLQVAAGLTRCQFGATVAHECMHSWLAQCSFPKAPDQVVEGICELVAYGYLVKQSADPRARVVARAMRRDPDPTYGDGFRLVRGLAQRLGADAVIEHVRRTGQLPPDPNQE